jgi:chemotaxis protein MotB
MPDGGEKSVIHVKRIKKVAGGHHGGAWKIAYADFVTAMMAFFLLMWLLGSTAKGDLKGISEYFQTPLKVSLSGGSGSGDSSHIIKGGGESLTRSTGQIKNGERPGPRAAVDIKAAEAERARREKDFLKGLQARVEAVITANPKLAPYRDQLLLDITTEGLRIQIVDEKNRPMFDSGSSQLKPYAKDIVRELAQALNGVDQRIGLAGHTDAASYAFGDKSYSNWELSADRANATRRELVGGGLADNKIIRVVGLGSAVLAKPDAPLDAANRRVTIVVLNQATEKAIGKEGATELQATEDNPVPAQIAASAEATKGGDAAPKPAVAAPEGGAAAAKPSAPAPTTTTKPEIVAATH